MTEPLEPEPETELQGQACEPSTPPSAHRPQRAHVLSDDAWSPAVPAAHHTPGFRDRSERQSFWLWLAWRLRDASVVVADEVVPASEITADSELVLIELNRDAVGTEAVLSMQNRIEDWRTVQASTSLEDPSYIVVQVDSAGRALSRRVDDIATEVRGHAVHRNVDIIRGQPCLLHSRSRRMLLWLACFQSVRLPIGLFRKYFGDQITLYFEMTEKYIRALQPLSVAGVALWLIEARGRRWPNNILTHKSRIVYRVLANVWTVTLVYAVDRQQRAGTSASNTARY